MLTLARGKYFHFEMDSGTLPRNSAFYLGLHSLTALPFTLMNAYLKRACTRVILASLLDRRHTHT